MAPPRDDDDVVAAAADGGQTQYVQVQTPRAGADDAALTVKHPDAGKHKSATSSESGDADASDGKKSKAKKKKTTKGPAEPVMPFSELYRYATPADKLFLVFGVLMAGVNGALFPCMALVFGKAITAFGQIPDGVYLNLYTIQEEKAQEEAMAAAEELANARAGGDDDEVVEMVRKSSAHSLKSDRAGDVEVANEGEATPSRFTILDAMAFSRPERKFFVFGMIAAGVNGFSLPSSAILISEMVATMTEKYMRFQDGGDW
ncbi:hypothetical protein PybrP1_011854, partial [[Pythium] brassicae (nom. inval.)]